MHAERHRAHHAADVHVVAVHVELDSLSVVSDQLDADVAALVAAEVRDRLLEGAGRDVEVVATALDHLTLVVTDVPAQRAHARARDLLVLVRESLRVPVATPAGVDRHASVRARCGAAVGPGPVDLVVSDARLAAADDRPGPSERHGLLLHHDDDAFLDTLGAFVADGLDAGETVALAATSAHLRRLDRRLAGRLDVTALVASGRLVFWDAEALLASVRPFGTVNTGRFDALVEPLIRGLVDRGPVRVYGELVALLYAEGDVLGACHVEERWNALVARHDFSLLCGYPASVGADPRAAGAICTHHGAVHQPVSVNGG